MQNLEEFKKYSAAVSKSVTGMLEEPVIEKLDQIKAPTLVLFGAQDALIPNRFLHKELILDNLLKDAEEKFSDVRTSLIPGGGHFVNFEKAKTVNEEIKKFVR